MTKGLNQLFDLPSMEDILTEQTETIELDNHSETIPVSGNELITLSELKSQEHSKSMDDIHDEVIQHARDAAELAFDLDPARAPRMLEVASMYYKTAIDAKNSKRDAQLKLMKLIQDQRKLELEEKKYAQDAGVIDANDSGIIMIEDRNALLKRLREEANLSK